MGGKVQYDTATGKPLVQGQTTVENKDLTPLSPTTPASITSASLNPATPVTPTVPAPQPVSTPPDFTKLTSAEQQAQGNYASGSKSLADLLGILATRDQFTTEQQANQDVIGKQKAVNDYTNQIKALQQEAQGISLQEANDQNKARLDASGKGITTGVLGSQQRGIGVATNELRLQNAIKQYSVGAQLSAAQGDLASALNYVDQAVKLKYQGVEAQIEAQKANLQAIQASPEYTSAQKKQAAAMELQLDTYKEQKAVERENTKSIQALALQALQNGAPAVIVNKIANSKDLSEAMQNSVGYAQKETVQSIQEYNYYARQEKEAGRVPVSYNEYQNMDANRKIAIAKASASGMPNQTLQKVLQVAGQFDNEQVVKNYNVIKEAQQFVNNLSNTTTNPSDDQGLIYALAKVLDPNSVVREGEYATAQRYSQSLISAYGESINQALNGTGFLSETARKNIKDTITQRAKAAEQNYKNVADEYARRINKVGGITDGKDYITDYSGGYSDNAPQKSSSSLSSDVQKMIQGNITFNGQNAYLPKSIWDSLGTNKDAVLAEAKADGYTLLIK